MGICEKYCQELGGSKKFLRTAVGGGKGLVGARDPDKKICNVISKS